jgi:hypothetical protein
MIDVSKLTHLQAAIVLLIERCGSTGLRGCEICRELDGSERHIRRELATLLANGIIRKIIADVPRYVIAFDTMTPESCTMTPESCTMTPESCTMTPESCTMTPESCTMTPESCTMTPESCTMTPESCTMTPESCTMTSKSPSKVGVTAKEPSQFTPFVYFSSPKTAQLTNVIYQGIYNETKLKLTN